MRCSNGSAQCVNRQCQCASVKRVYPMTTNTPVSCKTIFDCAASHQCPDNMNYLSKRMISSKSRRKKGERSLAEEVTALQLPDGTSSTGASYMASMKDNSLPHL
ncbi:hypothetical protein Bca4012_094058 [Brassica carinata]